MNTEWKDEYDQPIAHENRMVRGLPLTAQQYLDVPGANNTIIERGWYVEVLIKQERLHQVCGPHRTPDAAFDEAAQYLKEHGH